MESSKARRAALRKLLVMGQASTQVELCRMLDERGHRATQSTVSRDLKLLGAQRMQRDDGEQVYHLRSRAPGGFPAEMIVAVDANENMVVVRTRIGRAQAVGLEIDEARVPGILGTVAGDDTVLVIPKSVTGTAELARRLRELAAL
ncbi:MAG: arginine repressor [Deltaproteobacteria bacterium]|nr:arginine repressor [Nannocystaceae bacterium]